MFLIGALKDLDIALADYFIQLFTQVVTIKSRVAGKFHLKGLIFPLNDDAKTIIAIKFSHAVMDALQPPSILRIIAGALHVDIDPVTRAIGIAHFHSPRKRKYDVAYRS